MAILRGYKRNDYVSKVNGKRVLGYRLYFTGPSAFEDVVGEEVFEESMTDEKIGGVELVVGAEYNILWGKGFQGKAVPVQIVPVMPVYQSSFDVMSSSARAEAVKAAAAKAAAAAAVK